MCPSRWERRTAFRGTRRVFGPGLPRCPNGSVSPFLRYYADLDYRSIAEVLGVEVGTVSATLSSAHTALRRALQEVRE